MFLKHKNLFKNLLLIIVLILLPAILLNVFFTVYFRGYIKNEEFEKDTKFLSLVGQTFDTVLGDIIQVASLMEFDELLISSMEGLVESNGQISPSKFIYLNSVWSNTSRNLIAKPYIRSAYFYVDKAKDFVFTTEGIQSINNMADQNWLDSYYDQPKNIVYWSNVREELLSTLSNSSVEVVSLYRKFPFLKGQDDSEGVIVINLERKYFDSQISNIPGIQYKKVYILDDKYVTIYSNSSDAYDTYVDMQNISRLKKNSNTVKNIEGNEYLISTVQSKSFDWVYILVTPTKNILSELNYMTKISIAVCFLLLVISIILSVFYSINNYKPVKTMINIITQYNDGKDISNFTVRKNDEYEYIIYNMIKNFIDKNEFRKKLTEEKLLQKETQLYALQTQINPHFLYNALEALNWEAIDHLGKDNSISEILIHLSNNLRYATNYSNGLVTIEEDITQLKYYTYMLEVLNQNRIKFFYNIDHNLIACSTLKLLIQPLVENAAMHGLSDKRSGGKVKITAKDKGTIVEFCVVDNGCGITKKELAELRHSLESTDIFVSRNLGLKNINNRIKIRFGEQYGIKVRSKVNFGTSVKITFPKILGA